MELELEKLRSKEVALDDIDSIIQAKITKHGEDLMKILFFVPYKHEFSLLALGHLSLFHEVNSNSACKAIADRGFFYDFLLDKNDTLKENPPQKDFLSFYRHLKTLEFDIVSFGLTNPGSFMDIFKFFDMLGIPYKNSERRKSDYPLVVGGGPGFSNPEPYVDFLDLFVVGDGELPILNLLNYANQLKKETSDRKSQILRTTNDVLDNIYSPAGFKHIYDGKNLIAINKLGSSKTKNDYNPIKGSNSALHRFSSRIFTNNTGVVLANKGCKYNCIFCQLGKDELECLSFSAVIDAIDELLAAGVRHLIINSPTFTQYAHKNELLDYIHDYISSNGIEGFSLYIGSVRIDELDEKYIERLKSFGTFNHTYMKYTSDENGSFIATAPEFGSERLLESTGKGLTRDKIVKGIQICKENGVSNYHLYFMVGMDGETSEDRKEIATLVREIYNSTNREGNIYLKINLHIPTANTVGQRLRMYTTNDYKDFLKDIQEGLEELFTEQEREKIRIIPLEESRLIMESILMRGDRRMGQVIDYIIGNNIDVHTLKYESIKTIFENLGLDYDHILRRYGPEEILPWEVVNKISSTSEKRFFKRFFI